MKDQIIHTSNLNEADKVSIAEFGSYLLSQKQKSWFLSENRKVIYSGQLNDVQYLERDTFEYIIEGRSVKVLFPLDQTVRFSEERLEFLTGVSVKLEGLPLKEEDHLLLLHISYPEHNNIDKLQEDHLMEMPAVTKNKILLVKEGLNFCFFIFAILFSGQFFDKDEPERYRTATYLAGACLLAFIAGYYYIEFNKKSWLRPTPVMSFRGSICQVLYIVDNSGDSSIDEVIYITGSRTFTTWKRDKDICPGDNVSVIFKPFTKPGFRNLSKPDVLEIEKIDPDQT